MKKIKGQGGITKFIASTIGAQNKKFAKNINNYLKELRKRLQTGAIEIDVVSFSSSRDFYDQVLSILSFLKNIGTPNSWTLYSDGSHTDDEVAFFENNFTFLRIIKPDLSTNKLTRFQYKETLLPYIDTLLDYSKKYPLGKKLLYYLNHAIKRPTLFIDADILFYAKAMLLHTIIKEDVDGWYLPDGEWGCLDSRYKKDHDAQLYQVNSGFFLLKKEINNLKPGLDFLASLKGDFEYFSEQSVFHILFKRNGFLPVDPRIFILNSGDQFDFSYLYSREKIAIRHYTGPVRHKMWQRDWRWQLSLS